MTINCLYPKFMTDELQNLRTSVKESFGNKKEIPLDDLKGRGFWRKIKDDQKTGIAFLENIRDYHRARSQTDIPTIEIKQQILANLLQLEEAIMILGEETVKKNSLKEIETLLSSNTATQTRGMIDLFLLQTIMKTGKLPLEDFIVLYKEKFGKDEDGLENILPANINQIIDTGEQVIKNGFEAVQMHTENYRKNSH